MGKNEWENMTIEQRFNLCKKCKWNNRTATKLSQQSYEQLTPATIGVINYILTGVKKQEKIA